MPNDPCARLFFNVLHPPLNVPALCMFTLSLSSPILTLTSVPAVSLNEDIDTNKELVGHGYSNLLAGLVGTVYVPFFSTVKMTHDGTWYRPNYLVYINTLLFYRVGGNSRIAGFMLALATTALLFIGTGPIAYIRKLVYLL